MLLQSSRFGIVEIDESRCITFPKGILGFPKSRRYALLQPEDDGHFYWLQSVEDPGLAFIITDPSVFVPSYRVPLKVEQMEDLGVRSLDEAQVFVIVNKHGNLLTGNLQGPLVVGVGTRLAEQLVLSDRRFTTRVPLVELAMPMHAASA